MSKSPEQMTPYDQFNIEVPEDHFPVEGMSARAAQALVLSDEWTDTNPMLNMSSFVTTFAEPEAVRIAEKNMYKNYIDHDMYPQLFAMEQRMVRWLHQLWNGPKDAEPYGTATVGSSEACMLAGLAHKWNWRQRREREGKDATRPNMVTGGNVQIVWKKFLRYFDVEPRIVPLKPGQYCLTAEDLDKYVDENTIAVVAIAGQTFTGEDDDIQGIHDWLDAYEKKTGVSVPMHIDGASGGFVNPFLYPDYKWDFRLPRVQSINASGHKYGLTPPGLGWVIFRERKVFNEDLVFYVNYLGGEMPTATLNFSRNSFQVAVQYYQFLRLGFDGFKRVMQRTLDNAIALRQHLVDSGYFTIMNDTQRIPVVAVTLDPKVKKFNEFDVSNKVRERGWVISAYTMPPDAESVRSLRVVVRPHINRNVALLLAEDIVKACKYLEQHGGTATPPALHDTHKSSPAKC
ncbi:glutamate decarboxylase [Bordetella bronchiseptica]|uniref:Glutamate decarboxylase n=4 Tax=Bordetella bronchiseptica TaxID=518 RepID=A0A0H3LNT3_BORBR|nr:glutamate decarboxylase [Bordetella bronchiseptica]KAK65689.1 glutamate decarboxylase [Bordetella bronchiseptica 980-2]SHS79221.1 glutamate decarboxylase [Mycobacteroides abscessus subsp. abscessus]AMG88892.1 glutamate decarboxylase [Bordetella bronchiseptica]AWP75291.1 glutamate decarboxylase [Bordetella bronchiseptica]AWP80104.1 glutamate decarboxylase [Bordetella bronchiseptica]